ncbi:Dynein light chain, cytoplasmic, partial [Linum perenne]
VNPVVKSVRLNGFFFEFGQEFDGTYGPAWHCIAGKSFGSFVTHANGGFVYFSVDEKLCLLLFKTEVRPVVKPPPARKH